MANKALLSFTPLRTLKQIVVQKNFADFAFKSALSLKLDIQIHNILFKNNGKFKTKRKRYIKIRLSK